jgi:transcriptional regulator of acetoin/glycerol metabolism
LYYRLNGLVVKLPPIRERTDLETVINKVLALESISVTYSVAPDIMQLFKQHNWPGNFRQLTNLLRTAIVMADDCHEIRREHLPDDFLEDVESLQSRASEESTNRFVANGSNLEEMEISVIQKSLESHSGNVSATARALGVSRNTIYRKISVPK